MKLSEKLVEELKKHTNKKQIEGIAESESDTYLITEPESGYSFNGDGWNQISLEYSNEELKDAEIVMTSVSADEVLRSIRDSENLEIRTKPIEFENKY
jgi:hypothetical protein